MPGPADGELKRYPDPIAAMRGLLLMKGGEGRVQREGDGTGRRGKQGRACFV